MRFRAPFAMFLALAGSPCFAGEKLEYNRDIRPILVENCYSCHGVDSAARKADLRLDLRETAIKSGALVPGKPKESAALQRILDTDPDSIMPPAASHKKLTDTQKKTIERWIAEGAEYQLHWSLLPAKRPEVPRVEDGGWSRNPIDRFLFAEMKRKGLSPAPEADRRTLARRLALDLTGLPPDPADVEAFVNDKAPDAYEKLVDKFMASPHWGEHRGRFWLDASRYGDTHGIHIDNYREIWPYRDWVINAFNANMPFDRFSIEQLAGDLLPNPTLEQKIATGFHRCNITTSEGGAIDEEYLVLYARDRSETTATVWMGLTAGCAVCHDHKYDPISSKDFYSFSAFFNNTTQRAMDGNVKDTPPIINVPRKEDRARWTELEKLVVDARGRLDKRRAEAQVAFDKEQSTGKLTPAGVLSTLPDDNLAFFAWLDEGQGNVVRYLEGGKLKLADLPAGIEWKPSGVGGKGLSTKPSAGVVTFPNVGDFEADKPFTVSARVKVPFGQYAPIVARMNGADNYRGWDLWIENNRFGAHFVGQWPMDGMKIVSKNAVRPNKWYQITLTWDGSRRASGLKLYVDGELQPVDLFANNANRGSAAEVANEVIPKGSIKTNVPLAIGKRWNVGQVIPEVQIEDLRIYSRAVDQREAAMLAAIPKAAGILARPKDKRTPEQASEVFAWWLATHDKPWQDLSKGLDALVREETDIRSRGAITHIMTERAEPPVAHVLFRGEYDKRRDKVGPATFGVLPAMPADLPKNRLGLAKWLFRPEHPLTARVTVNRFWQEVFGQGLVRTSGDFGLTGELPSHPALLDWMAVEFREQGWDIKKFYKLLVTSAAYRQSAYAAKDKLEKDPSNVLLARGPRFRLDAELIRDYALAASGLMVRKIGGPSVRPYQPDGVWEAVAMPGSDTRDYRADKGENLYRRSMYTFWKRAAPPASMEIMNAPTREVCTVRRERTNTPLQALVTLNDIQFVESARHLATRGLSEGGATSEQRLDWIARRLLARPLESEERQTVMNLLGELTAWYKSRPDEAKKLVSFGETPVDPKKNPSELAAWTMVVNQMMNLDEVLVK